MVFLYLCPVLRIIALPFLPLYLGITVLRNWLYNKNIMRSSSFDMPVIVMGNLSTGGTGKTPHTRYVIELLKDQYSTAMLSRGYGRRTKGFFEVKTDSTSNDCGDEPLQLKRQLGEHVKVAVDGNRVRGMLNLLYDYPQLEAVVLDDAFQHRPLNGGLNILLTTYDEPFFKDYILPIGNLREIRKGAERAQAVIVTKCPANPDRETYINRIAKYTRAPVFFSEIVYGELIPVNRCALEKIIKENSNASIMVVTGIASPAPLITHLQQKFTIAKHIEHNDHHRFSQRDLNQIVKIFSTFGHLNGVVTTEKDAMRLQDSEYFDLLTDIPLYYQAMHVRFTGNGHSFDTMIKDYVNANQIDRSVDQSDHE